MTKNNQNAISQIGKNCNDEWSLLKTFKIIFVEIILLVFGLKAGFKIHFYKFFPTNI